MHINTTLSFRYKTSKKHVLENTEDRLFLLKFTLAF